MKVLHTGTLDVKAGGPAMSTYNMLYGLRQCGVDAQIVMPPLLPGSRLRGNDVPILYTSAPKYGKLAYSASLKGLLRSVENVDIYQAQGIWQYPTYVLASVAREKGKPYIIVPRGMLYPQDIAKSNKLFKEISLKVRLLTDLNRAACIQVTCEEEMRHCRNLGVKSPIAIIPNPVEIVDYPYKKQDDVFRLGYLGRMSRRKNIEGLIYAFAELRKKAHDAELLIISGGDDVYEAFLKAEVNRLGITGVTFAGFLSGEAKDKALASLSVLAMPSEFENLGNVILEGLVRRIPCIATKGAPWEELNTHHCGWWVDYSQEALNKTVLSAYSTSAQELLVMGDNGRKLMERNYSIDAVAAKMESLYEWIIAGSRVDAAPSFVDVV